MDELDRRITTCEERIIISNLILYIGDEINMLLKALLQAFFDGIKNINKKNWTHAVVKCCDCGNTWNCVFPTIKGGEYKLECPKCKHRNSQIVTYK